MSSKALIFEWSKVDYISGFVFCGSFFEKRFLRACMNENERKFKINNVNF